MEYTVEEINERTIDIQSVIEEIIARYNNITTLQEASEWKSDALALQNLISRFKADVTQIQKMEEALLEQEKNTRKNLSFLKKFNPSKGEKEHENNIQNIAKGIISIEVAKSNIFELITVVPANNEELKTILSKLNNRKKELTVEKRSINEEMRQIRTGARQARAKLSGFRGGTMGKIATYQRAGITSSTENKLSPLESQKGRIEYELIKIDQQINRLNGFVGDDVVFTEIKVLRCSYCGRRLITGEVCPGCGSDKTTYELS